MLTQFFSPSSSFFISKSIATKQVVSTLVLLILVSCLFLQPHPSNARSLISCNFDQIYQLGDSISNTGNLIREKPLGDASAFAKPPYGETFFKSPTGRCSNGRLMIDFIGNFEKRGSGSDENQELLINSNMQHINDLEAGDTINVGCFSSDVELSVMGNEKPHGNSGGKLDSLNNNIDAQADSCHANATISVIAATHGGGGGEVRGLRRSILVALGVGVTGAFFKEHGE
ncbi:hypothetical protein Vadar_014344 [Vaccinium darrowii]|uniref:Uncharacterized protein n=1 Tax=Vaccinium darrowii TaxID=229202 RepID=A0ACB7XZF5_9ERIC|nr:hypothetical protein Vadar_014344 [Vaccinium darrowii]